MGKFTKNDFELFNKYAKKRDSDFPEAHEELRKVYNKLGSLCDLLPKDSYTINIRRNPKNQGGVFESYHWARVYPNELFEICNGKICFAIAVDSDGLNIHIDGLKSYQLESEVEIIKEETYHYINDIEDLTLPELAKRLINYMEEHKETLAKLADTLEINKDKMTGNISQKDNSEIINLLKYKKQIILQGPPGTGKTREAKLIAKELMELTFNYADMFLIQVGDYLETLTDKTKFIIKEVSTQSFKVKPDASKEETNGYNVNFDQVISCINTKGWLDKTESWNLHWNASYLQAIAKNIYTKKQKKIFEGQCELVQFHPSYTYEDFVRGIVVESNGNNIEYKTINKTLGEFAEKAKKNYDDYHKTEEKWAEAQYINFKNEIGSKLNGSKPILLKENQVPQITAIEDDAIRCNRYNNPDDSVLLKDRDIINGYLGVNSNPSIKVKENMNLSDSARSGMYYLYQNLIEKFTTYLNDNNLTYTSSSSIVKPKLKNYILIIDEINRANLSSVLGELIYALEYRGENIKSMYKLDDGNNDLTLPPNLYIIGTMNTADRSVGHIDYAIRRRFAFVDVLPKDLSKEVGITFDKTLFETVSKLFVKDFDSSKDYSKRVIERAKTLSEEFDPKDVWLGHSYFIDKSDDGGNMQIRLEYEIKPILREYIKDGVLVGENEYKNDNGEVVQKSISKIVEDLKTGL